MPIPRFLVAVPLLAAGIFLPVVGPDLTAPPAGALGMGHEVFAKDVVQVRQGDTLTFVNDSRFIHIIGPGRDGHLEHNDALPVAYRRLMETNASYTSGKWTNPGTYYLTCSVHPEMTVKVIVTECGCCSNGTC
jgi:plastocyanin